MLSENEHNEYKDIDIAMLIDGDNAQPSLIQNIIREAEKYGRVTIRRVYGDWTQSQLSSWKKHLHVNAIQPIQQFAYTSGKNSTDSALIIDAMDILHIKTVKGFCIVASDSDYTKLAVRIREQGLFVLGIGENKTPKPFVKACERFVYTEYLTSKETSEKAPIKTEADVTNKQTKKDGGKLLELFLKAFTLVEQEGGWASLGAFAHALRKIDTGFDPRLYGENQIIKLIQRFPNKFEIKLKDQTNPATKYLVIKE